MAPAASSPNPGPTALPAVTDPDSLYLQRHLADPLHQAWARLPEGARRNAQDTLAILCALRRLSAQIKPGETLIFVVDLVDVR